MSSTTSAQTGKRIDSLQALRALAFLGVFFSHARFFIAWPELGVSIFFVMSGFLLIHSYRDREMTPSLKYNADFSIKKIRKLYPIHIITMFISFAFYLFTLIYIMHERLTIKKTIELIGKIGLNVALLQTWIPLATLKKNLYPKQVGCEHDFLPFFRFFARLHFLFPLFVV